MRRNTGDVVYQLFAGIGPNIDVPGGIQIGPLDKGICADRILFDQVIRPKDRIDGLKEDIRRIDTKRVEGDDDGNGLGLGSHFGRRGSIHHGQVECINDDIASGRFDLAVSHRRLGL